MPQKPKINKILSLQCFPLWGSGSGTYARELALTSNQYKNIKQAIICPESEGKISGIKIYPLELPFPVAFTGHPDWPICKIYAELTPKEITRVFNYFLRSTVKAVNDFEPDLLHVHHTSLLLWVANFIKSLYGINFVVTSHGTGVLAASQQKAYVPLSQDALRRSKQIVAVSGDTKDWLLNTFGKEFSYKTRIIPGGIHVEDFPPEKKTSAINKKYKLKGEKSCAFFGKTYSPERRFLSYQGSQRH